MAFRFFREGQKFKNRSYVRNSDITNFVDELQWDILKWHYEYWMGLQAKQSIMRCQQGSEELQYIVEKINSGKKSNIFHSPTYRFYFCTFIPNVVPFNRTSNPFCLYSPNRTGWIAWRKGYIPFPKTYKNKKVAGVDPQPPIFPKVY